MPKRSPGNNGTEAAEPKRRSERLQAKPETPNSEPKKATVKGKKTKFVEKTKPEEKKEDAKRETEETMPAENGEAKAEEETNSDGEAGDKSDEASK
ncbi:non-histone chromosomal protein HMG-14A-like [Xyrauchen texanus]|uniref:non-histone chromosomal protein HMG-14A-like n=1 Tax=Xyrauchen texanus TaxID=154827 RepID=UPI0022422505|nr:non-histone chromosomal protein HMG-14A-like [Xyrauchen texanus]